MTYKVLISDNLSKDIIYKFNEADIDVVYSPEMGKNSSLILNEIHNFDAIAIRSDTKINSALLNSGNQDFNFSRSISSEPFTKLTSTLISSTS